MGLMLRYLILLACAPLLILILHMAATRISVQCKFAIPNQFIVIICAAIGHIPMAAAVWMIYLRYLPTTPQLVLAIIYSFIVYNSLAYSYFHIFNMSDTARRVRILYEIYTAKQLKLPQMASLYNAHDMLHSRLERLLSMKQIKHTGDRYLLDHKLLYYAAKAVAGWGHILGFA